MRIPFVPVVLAVLLSVASVRAENWTEFRGPTGEGHAKGPLPVEWGPEKNVQWKQEVAGLAWSSPVVVDGKVYLTTAVVDEKSPGKDLTLRAICFDAKSGLVAWDIEVFRHPAAKVPKHHGKNSNASPTPIVEAGKMYVHFGHLGTACLDLAGKVLWRNNELVYSPVHGNGGTPILADDLLVFSIDGSNKQALVALEKTTGKVKWQTDRKSMAPKKFSFSTPLLIEVAGRKQIVSPASDVVMACDAKTGEEIWRCRYTGYSVIPRPVYGHGLLFLATSYDSPTFLAIRADGTGDVTDTHIAWSIKKNAPHTPSPLLVGDEVYMVSDSGFASCLDAKTGKVHWSERLGGAYSASPIDADGKIYFQSEEGVGTVIKAGKTFEVLARNDMKERTLASYAAIDGAIFLRTASKLYRIGQ